MILRVKLEDFAAAARRYALADEAFISDVVGGVSISAVNVSADVMVTTSTDLDLEETRQFLEQAGLTVRDGQWASDLDQPEQALADLHIAAVAYRSNESMPGLWMEAYPTAPTPADVLLDMYQEFVSTGELREIGIDEFKKLANPNVLILGPEEIRSFALKQQPPVEG